MSSENPVKLGNGAARAEGPPSQLDGLDPNLLELATKFLANLSPTRDRKPASEGEEAAELPEDRLPTTAERYRVLVEQIPAVVFMLFLDAGLSEAYVSPQVEQMLGFSREEWLDDPIRWYGQIHSDDKQRWSIEAADLLLTGNPLRSTYRVMARDGKVIWFQCEAKLVRKRNGEPWFVHGVGFDVTELKETEQALHAEIAERERLQKAELDRQIARMEQSESRLAAIVESSEDAILAKDLDGTITSWNAAATRLFGYEPSEIIGKSILLLVPPELHEQEYEILKKLRAGERIQHRETQRLKKSGAPVDVSLTISPIKDATGKVIGASNITRDITARKAAEEKLRITEKLAATGRLAATIAHEINNPLEAVTNLLYLAKKRPANSLKYLQIAEEELERVAQITKQTLGFYRDTSAVAPVDLRAVLDDVLTLYSKRLETRAIAVVKQYEEEAVIEGMAGEIRQVFANVIGNAVEAMPQGGRLTARISVRAKARVPGVRVTISDTGGGIETENLKKIFEPFFTTKKEVGTGLGLWLTKTLVERHGGRIKVRSSVKPGSSGSVFSVFFPGSRATVHKAVA